MPLKVIGSRLFWLRRDRLKTCYNKLQSENDAEPVRLYEGR
jgi:hypothetical protein